ncbi:tetratricopeptide repeat protein [Leptolyngbya iicbica]|uniref:Tetratricopeptide repeat protein n=2 Tax=Cyanophyceae TaxID=3028117 RepID=A0A4Q7E3C3_9CYAN|nr:tetratricopeptide repeat protein [Leptolyngbya sp. LK]RZM76507.1 tetratricopeptide repeat protein [Leptolyngbya sp. LK]
MSRFLHSWAQQQQGRYLLRRGLNFAQKGNYPAAVQSLTAALSYHPQPTQIFVRRGLLYLQQERYAEALTDFDQAIAIAPNQATAYGHRGLVRYQLGDETGALTDWATSLKLNPSDGTVRYNRGLVMAQKGQYQAALEDFNVAIAQNPLLAEAYLHRGKVRNQLGDQAGAVKDWEIALCNDLRLSEAQQLLVQTQTQVDSLNLQDQFQDLLPAGLTIAAEQQGTQLTLTLHRPVGTPVNYFQLPNVLRDRLVELQLPEVRRFRLLAKAGDSSLSEWDQTYGIYDKAPCPSPHWRDAVATTLLLFPPFGVLALVLAAQVKPAYRRGDYPIAARASKAVRKLCLSSGAIMGVMLFGLASYGVYTYVEGEYPNPAAKTAMTTPPEDIEKPL